MCEYGVYEYQLFDYYLYVECLINLKLLIVLINLLKYLVKKKEDG